MANLSEFEWHSEMFDLTELYKNPVSCVWGACLPSFLFGLNVNKITDGQTPFKTAALNHLARGGCCCWCCCLPSYTAQFREQLRKKRNLPMDPYTDEHVHRFCHPCALCQEARELDAGESAPLTGPKHKTIDRTPEDTMPHLEEHLKTQSMEK